MILVASAITLKPETFAEAKQAALGACSSLPH